MRMASDEWNHCHSNKCDKEIRRLSLLVHFTIYPSIFSPIPYQFFKLPGNMLIKKCKYHIPKLFFSVCSIWLVLPRNEIINTDLPLVSNATLVYFCIHGDKFRGLLRFVFEPRKAVMAGSLLIFVM